MDSKTSHPDQIHSQLGLIAGQLNAAGLVDEARLLQGLQRRVSGEYQARLLTVHKAAPANAAVPQIALRVQLVEIRQTPETAAAMKAFAESAKPAAASPDDPSPWPISGVVPTAGFSKLIDRFVEQGLAKIVAQPQLTLLNGRTAEFRQGYEIPAEPANDERVEQAAATTADAPRGTESLDEEVSDRFVGTFVRTTAVIVEDNRIRLSFATGQSERISGEFAVGVTPVNRRRLKSTVEIRESQTIVLGGHVSTSMATEVSRIPFLGDVPGIGRLFSSKKTRIEERHSLVVVTPEIVQPADAHEVPPVSGFEVPRPLPVESLPARKQPPGP